MISGEDDTDASNAVTKRRLAAGFAWIRQKRPPFLKKQKSSDNVTVDSAQRNQKQIQNRRVKVQFLDPVSTVQAPFAGSSSKGEKTPPPDLYEKITTMFSHDYANTVKQLAYQDVRSKAQNRIDQVHVTCAKLESVVLLEEAPQSPLEWHKIPACHVYLVSCGTLEDYRQKVKPSIQAFVSQLTDKRERPYLLVYCPTAAAEDEADTASTGTSSSSASTIGNALAQRPAARAGLALAARFRQRMNASGTGEEADDAVAPPLDDFTWNRLSHLTRTEREVYRRLEADFGKTNLCALSIPSMDPASTASFKKTEWSSFLQALGAALARGFQEQCKKYDEALREMDAQRGNKAGFDVSQFFLLKESWAFLYEQYNLPAEALLQYKEARILLPDIRTDALHKVVEDDILSGIEGAETRGDRAEDIWSELSQMVHKGDFDGFRRELALIKTLEPIAPALEDYLFVRETDLLFLMADPVEVLLRSLSYVTAMVDFRLEQTDTPAVQIEIEEWAFSFCWDLKEASTSYLPESALTGEAFSRRPVVENFSRTLCDILAYARLRLLKMANLQKTTNLAVPALSTDLQSAWEPYNSSSHRHEVKVELSNGQKAMDTHDSLALLKDAFSSHESFQDCYLEVMKVAIAYNTLAGRHRAAARLRMEVVEIYFQRGQTHDAAETLVAIAAVYDRDQWLACNFLLLFRLAGFQRRIAPPVEYIRTLFRCFSAGSKAVAPPKALVALQADLEAVVETDEVYGQSLESSPVFSPSLGLPDRNSHGTSDRKLVRKVYSVGDEATVVLNLSSFLCNSIDGVSIKIDLVPYQTHVLAAEDDLPTKKSDVVRVLTLDHAVALSPGDNTFEFTWIPLSSGQFIASSILMEWKGIKFIYAANEIQNPMVRIDVLPADADQSMSVTPSFLLPGHEQPLHIDFLPGLDDVESGEVQFVCSPGLLLLPPGDETGEQWVSSGTVPLPPCSRGKAVRLTANVKSVKSEEMDSSAPTVHVKITTQYRSIPAGVSDAEADKYKQVGSLLTHEMDAVIPTLGSPSVTVKDLSLTSHMMGQTVLGIILECHTPDPFVIRSWHLELPSYLILKEDIDMNAAVAGTSVKNGDVVHFGFLCETHSTDFKGTTATMVVDVEDQAGFVFQERLDVRLRRKALPRIGLPQINSVPVKVEVSESDGPMGTPIRLLYSFDTTIFREWTGDVIYEVSVDSEDWILSGSCRGLVNRGGDVCNLDFMAVPVRPGPLGTFPEISVYLDDKELERPFPLSVRLVDRPIFTALTPSSQSTIVYAAFEC